MKGRRLIGDGLIWISLGIALPAVSSVLYRNTGIIGELFGYVLGLFIWPYKYFATHVNGEIAKVVGTVHEVGFKSHGPEVGDYLLLGIGILEYLVYWFVAGVIICGVWRASRNHILALWEFEKLTLPVALTRMGRLFRGAISGKQPLNRGEGPRI